MKMKSTVSSSGTLVDIGRHKLHITVKGEGSPTVVVETAAGSLSIEWQFIQDKLAKVTRVVTYDRAGYGPSEPSPWPRAGEQVVAELHALLDKKAVAAPYVLVGHSQGGLYVNRFARRYPDEVAGVLFMDALSPDNHRFEAEIPIFGRLISLPGMVSQLRLSRVLAATGLFWLFKPAVKSLIRWMYPHLPANSSDELLRCYLSPVYYDTIIGELLSSHGESGQVDDAGPFPDVPLIVLYHSPDLAIHQLMKLKVPRAVAERLEALWEELNRDFLRLSPQSEWRTAIRSGHMIHHDQPDLVVETILSLVGKARTQA